MNYGLQHRYYAHMGAAPQTVNLLTPSGALNYGIPKNLPVIVLPKPVTPKPVTPIIPSDAAPAICLDESQNSVSCADPNCKYGDCGAPAGVQQITVGSLCLDQGENQIACTDPNCTFGDCVSSTSWWSKSSIVSGVPDIAIYGLLAMLLFGGGLGVGRRR